jgi:hypothetical protein
MKAAGRMFFYNHCNQEKKPPFADPKWTDNSWEITEPAIYYQAAYIRFLAAYCVKSGSSGIGLTEKINPDIRYNPFDASNWEYVPSGLLGKVILIMSK